MPVKKQEDFAAAFAELEKISEWFETEEIDLDEGLKKFERGLELATVCKKKLSEVENKVEEIKKKFSDLSDE
ncbi:MAG: exodeoxyribonuclease VII small subunit [Candidatus Uhrbacteria bacterium]|nr:exodeoxyribonuclease VII small subunit [Patescibacteria group bacterium]MBU1906964.1 exodeoxyribonuclease VII small subunit [Patescibacteria group bacterium]